MKNNSFDSWELTKFNLDGNIIINKYGILKIRKSDDGVIVLITDSNYLKLGKNNSKNKISDPDSALAFALDIGIQKKRKLTTSGFYDGGSMKNEKSNKVISSKNYNAGEFELINKRINSLFSKTETEGDAFKLKNIFDIYNNAHLLRQNFYSESYIDLMRILDSLFSAINGVDFALKCCSVSAQFNKEVFERVNNGNTVGKERTNSSSHVLKYILDNKLNTKSNEQHKEKLENMTEEGKFVFSCLYSAYQYRNVWIHRGFPFPIPMTYTDDYFSLSMGQSFARFIRDTGYEKKDLIDIHETIPKAIPKGKRGHEHEVEMWGKMYLLLPTWYFMKEIVRVAIIKELNKKPL
ncbi:MAG: hypothetical protein M0P76_05160 [Candidatus Pacebacteria bacterium]|jgi:hypothetical protein|nr:hypothetical protein [Candidatus Paceibacterota bacterium]